MPSVRNGRTTGPQSLVGSRSTISAAFINRSGSRLRWSLALQIMCGTFGNYWRSLVSYDVASSRDRTLIESVKGAYLILSMVLLTACAEPARIAENKMVSITNDSEDIRKMIFAEGNQQMLARRGTQLGRVAGHNSCRDVRGSGSAASTRVLAECRICAGLQSRHRFER
jgi:hypothetical protein